MKNNQGGFDFKKDFYIWDRRVVEDLIWENNYKKIINNPSNLKHYLRLKELNQNLPYFGLAMLLGFFFPKKPQILNASILGLTASYAGFFYTDYKARAIKNSYLNLNAVTDSDLWKLDESGCLKTGTINLKKSWEGKMISEHGHSNMNEARDLLRLRDSLYRH